MTSCVDGEELFQFLIRLENAILRHVLDRLDWPDTLALHLIIDDRAVSGDSTRVVDLPGNGCPVGADEVDTSSRIVSAYLQTGNFLVSQGRLTTAPTAAQAGDYLNTALVFSGIIMIAILGLALDACLRGLLLLADPSRRR